MNDLFFYASKILFWGIRPDMLVALIPILIFGLLLWGRMRLATWLAGLLGLFLMILGYVPLATPLLSPIESAFPVAPPLDEVDGIIVLGGGERGASYERWGEVAVNEAGERIIIGAMLAKRFPDAKLVFTGGSARDGVSVQMPEAEGAGQAFRGLGIAEDRIILEGQSRNTVENAILTRPLLPEVLSGNWVLVTSAYHMPRSVGVFCAAGFRNLIPYPVDHQAEGFHGFLHWKLPENLFRLRIAVKEWVGLTVYYATGRTQSFWPQGC